MTRYDAIFAFMCTTNGLNITWQWFKGKDKGAEAMIAFGCVAFVAALFLALDFIMWRGTK